MPTPIRDLYTGTYIGTRYKVGAEYNYVVDIPDFSKGKENLALYLSHDGYQYADADAMYDLVLTGECPPFIGIGVGSGELLSLLGEEKLGIRQNTYDPPNRDFPDFVVEELIPYLTEKYGLSISPDPNMHLVSGGSSGGISAWNMAWHRNDYFRRVYMSSPSFIDLGGGDVCLSRIRKHEPRPIRVYSDYSEYDAMCDYGSDITAGQEAEFALRFARYDAAFDFHSGFGHVSHYPDFPAAMKRMRFLWKNWQTEPVTVKDCQHYIKRVLDVKEPWIATDEPFPEKAGTLSGGRYSAAGEYRIDGSRLLFYPKEGEPRVVREDTDEITGVALSCDKWRMMLCHRNKPHGTAALVAPDGSLKGDYIHGVFENEMRDARQGAYDLCTDTDGLTYMATDHGIEVIRNNHMTAVILRNPEGKTAERIEIGVDGCLYALTADGAVYKRRLLTGKRTVCDQANPPKEPQ